MSGLLDQRRGAGLRVARSATRNWMFVVRAARGLRRSALRGAEELVGGWATADDWPRCPARRGSSTCSSHRGLGRRSCTCRGSSACAGNCRMSWVPTRSAQVPAPRRCVATCPRSSSARCLRGRPRRWQCLRIAVVVVVDLDRCCLGQRSGNRECGDGTEGDDGEQLVTHGRSLVWWCYEEVAGTFSGSPASTAPDFARLKPVGQRVPES
jgi:hypothetical protein